MRTRNALSSPVLSLLLAAAGAAWTRPARAAETGDGRALGILAAIDKNEIAVADEAVKKSTAPAVIDFAKMMRKDHNENLAETEALARRVTSAAPEMSAASISLRAKGDRELAVLMAKKGADFNNAYADAMVKGHAEALATIDNQLLKQATDPEVQKFLQATRERVAEHLKHAQTVQAGLAR